MAKLKITIPTDIRDEAKKLLNNIVKNLEKKEQIEEVDVAALTMFARAYSTYLNAEDELTTNGITFVTSQGNRLVNPAFKVSKDSFTTCMKIMEKFGLTTYDRKKLEDKNKEEEEKSPLVNFLEEEDD